MTYNPRRKNGSLRNKHRARFKALGLPCAICGGSIHYGEPSDSDHPLSFVIDEKYPVSRWQEFGYSSPEQAAQDWNNLQPVHYICNQRKRHLTMSELKQKTNFNMQAQAGGRVWSQKNSLSNNLNNYTCDNDGAW